MSFVTFAWIATFIYGFNTIAAKLISKYQLKNIFQYSFSMVLFSAIFSGTIAIFNGASFPNNWSFVLLSGLFLSLANVLYIVVLQKLDISVISSLYNIKMAIAIPLSFILLGEKFSFESIIIILIIICAGMFATMDEKLSIKSFFSKSIGLGLIFITVIVFQNIFINKASVSNDYWTIILWMGISATFFSFIFLFPKFKKDVSTSKISDYLGVLALSFFGTFGDLATFKAFSRNVGISSIIISLPISMILVFILSFWKPELLEKHTLKVYLIRFISAGVMIWGALKLSI